MKIVVLSGGLSTERNVSLASGTQVCQALRSLGHQAVLVDMFLGLEDYEGELSALFDAPDGRCSAVSIDSAAPDLEKVKASRKDKSASVWGKNVLELCRLADCVFLGLHGACGEDGRVQATFDLMGIPYTGAGYLSSGMAMDKAVTKRFMEHVGVLTPKWEDITYTADEVDALVERLPVPCAVKIVNGGSSIGVSLPEDRQQLRQALESGLVYGDHVIVEEKICGRELTVGILGDRYLPAVEIVPNAAYFDYEAKYQAGGAQEICPARISDAEWQMMGEAALKLHKALGLSVYSRTDFILTEEGKAYCLEVNTLPGMTPASLLPKEAAAAGLTYPQLCEWIVQESLKQKRGL